jgi:hypothetical protein
VCACDKKPPVSVGAWGRPGVPYLRDLALHGPHVCTDGTSSPLSVSPVLGRLCSRAPQASSWGRLWRPSTEPAAGTTAPLCVSVFERRFFLHVPLRVCVRARPCVRACVRGRGSSLHVPGLVTCPCLSCPVSDYCPMMSLSLSLSLSLFASHVCVLRLRLRLCPCLSLPLSLPLPLSLFCLACPSTQVKLTYTHTHITRTEKQA